MMTLRDLLPAALVVAAGLVVATRAAAEDEARFKDSARLYDTYCAQCHGVNRNGKGVNTVGLSVQPKDHSDTAGMSSIPRDEMAGAIRNGGASVNKSALMPAWGSVLTDAQVDQMVDYLLHVCKCSKPK